MSLRFGSDVASLQRVPDREVVLNLSAGQQVHGTEILIAADRRARNSGVWLESIGSHRAEHLVAVHDDKRVLGITDRCLYAVRDINGRGGLTHTSNYQASIAADAITAGSQGQCDDPAPWSSRTAAADTCAIPRVIFTDPRVAWVGLTRTPATREGQRVREVSVPLASPDGLCGDDELTGRAQCVLDGEDRLVGATFVGPNAAEVLHPSPIAVVGGLALSQMKHAIPS